MKNLWQDIRHSLRIRLKQPAATLVAIMVLAIGIGANSVIFSAVNAVLLNKPPYPNAERIVMVWGHNPRIADANSAELPTSGADFVDWQNQNRVFDQIAAFTPNARNLTEGGSPERIGGASVSSDFFEVFGLKPTLGRTFNQESEPQGNESVVVISHRLWERRFGSDPNIVGRSIALDERQYQIIGVMPAGFLFPEGGALPKTLGYETKIDIWTPLRIDASQRGNRDLNVIGKLKPNVGAMQAQTEMTTIASDLARQYSETNNGFGISVVPIHEQMVAKVRRALLTVFGAVAFVLLIACANVANLQLAQAVKRQKEIAVRTALGASQSRIVQQLLTESLLLSLVGGLTGLVLASYGIRLISAFGVDTMPALAGLTLDTRIIGFTLSVSILTGALFGLVPALQCSKPDLNSVLKEAGRGSTGRGHYFRNGLVIAEVALTLVLLIGAGLLIKSFIRLQSVDPGFNSHNLITMQINLPRQKYQTGTSWSTFYKQVTDRVQSLPGVDRAGLTFRTPFSGPEGSAGVVIEGRPEGERASAYSERVSPGYFDTIGMPIIRGRGFVDDDSQDANHPIIINEEMARRYWPNADPIGQHFFTFNGQNEIVGVVRNTKQTSLDAATQPAMFFPTSLWFMNLVVRTKVDPMAILPAIRQQISEVDKDLPLANVATFDRLLSDSVAPQRLNMILINVFAAIGIALSVVGIYGVISYTVSQNTREIGIRAALGAQHRDIFKLVVGQGLILTSIGVAIGIFAALGLTRLMASLLYDVSTTDLTTIASVSGLLILVAAAASYIPARRATRVDPMAALRCE